MAWFLSQSFVIIVTTFVLGLFVGWLWWGRQWRKVAFSESAAVQTVARRLESVVTERDSEIVRLQLLVDSTETTPRSEADASPGSAEPAPEAQPEPQAGATTAPADTPGTTDPTGPPDSAETAARPEAEPDDLERIEGIGPRIATALRTAGITTYHALAQADEEQLRAALREAGLAFAPSLVTWSRQAALLAGGDEAAFHELTSQLVRGPRRAPDPHSDPDPGDGAEPEAAAGDGAGDEAGVGVEDEDDAEPEDVPGDEGEPEDGDVPGDEGEEDLERVEGIGPRVATALRKAGIRTYRQLADSDVPTLQAALDASGLRFAPSLPTWPRQAALLADGDEDGFVALTNTLVAGRDSGRKA